MTTNGLKASCHSTVASDNLRTDPWFVNPLVIVGLYHTHNPQIWKNRYNCKHGKK